MMIKIIYYYFFQMYSKILVQDDPHFVSLLAVTAIESILINYLIDLISVLTFCSILLNATHKFFLTLIVLGINHWFLGRKNKGKAIISEGPYQLMNSRLISLSFFVIFVIFTISTLFWMSDYLIILEEKCK